MFDPKFILDVLRRCRGMNIGKLWLAVKDYPEFEGDRAKAKEGFFWLAEHFIETGELKIGMNGVPIDGGPVEQLAEYRSKWPDQYSEDVPELDIDNLWWLLVPMSEEIWTFPGRTSDPSKDLSPGGNH